MRIKIELDLDIGDMPYEDACLYMRYQYGDNTVLLAEPTTVSGDVLIYGTGDCLAAAETVVLDILNNELSEHEATNGTHSGTAWRITSSHVTVT